LFDVVTVLVVVATQFLHTQQQVFPYNTVFSAQYLMLGGSHAFHTETGKPGRFAPKLSCYYLLRFKEESGNIHFSLLSQVGFTTL
jgi:hypothetical protein